MTQKTKNKRNQLGENNNHCNITVKQVKHICRLLRDTDVSYTTIAIITEATVGQVRGIANHQTWLHISKNYYFQQRKLSVLRKQLNHSTID